MYSAINLLKCKNQTIRLKIIQVYSYTLQNLLIILKTLITFLEFTKFSDKCTAIHAMYTERRGIIEWIWCFKVYGYPASWIYNNFMIIVDGIFGLIKE